MTTPRHKPWYSPKGGAIVRAAHTAALFFQMLKSTVYFVAQKTLYVPLRLSPEGTEASTKLSPMFDTHRKIATRRRATGWASVSPFAGRYGSSGDMGPTFIVGME